MRLVLASQSPARLSTLRRAGLDPEVDVSGVDESAVDEADPAQHALTLATMKAEAVAVRQSQAYVVGCDSVLEIDGAIHGKPADATEAIARWRRMRGSTGVLHTGHCLIDTATGRRVRRAAATRVWFADLSDAEIDAYVANGEPLHVAGAFTIDGFGGPFVTRIEGDHHNVVGISLPLLREMFAELDVSWPKLWAPTNSTAGGLT